MRIAISFVLSLFAALMLCPSPSCQAAENSAPAAKKVSVSIRLVRNDPVIQFAADELVRYIELMADDKSAADVETFGFPPAGEVKPLIKLGLFSDFGIKVDGIADPEQDDAVYVKVKDTTGIIAGSNPRSVLFAAYRFLEANGCRWIRPRRDGDYVPHRTINNLAADIKDKAFYRFRGNSNCGTFSADDVVDRIAWSPKVGLNVFLIEFMLPKRQYNNYSSRPYPSLGTPHELTIDEAQAFHDLSVKELKRRGLIYHGVGHGWTGLVAGCSETQSDHHARPTPDPDKVKFLALNKGERAMTNGPTLTDICHGNPEAQQRFARCVADYATRHPEIDCLHVWLDDKPNNCCECPLCKDLFISDSYVKLLNRIDAELTRRKMDTKIVFIIYHETLWKPLKEKLKNQKRFFMMFAPISRDYTVPYPTELPANVDTTPYELNKCKLPKGVDTNIAMMKGWREVYQGPCFVYEYHMVWAHYFDFGYYDFAKVMGEDIRRLKKLGMDGMVSCQVGRANFPTGFPMKLHAQLLWNPNQDTDMLAAEYFQAAFGKDWAKALDYCKSLSKVSAFHYKRTTKEERQIFVEKMAEATKILKAFRPFIKEHTGIEPAVVQDSWKYLDLHSDITELFINALATQASGAKKAEYTAAWQKMVDEIARTEDQTHPVFDLFWFYSRCPVAKKLIPNKPVETQVPQETK